MTQCLYVLRVCICVVVDFILCVWCRADIAVTPVLDVIGLKNILELPRNWVGQVIQNTPFLVWLIKAV